MNNYKQLLESNYKAQNLNNFNQGINSTDGKNQIGVGPNQNVMVNEINNTPFNTNPIMMNNSNNNNNFYQGQNNFQFLNISNYYNYDNLMNPGLNFGRNIREFNNKSQWLTNEETFIRFNKRGWICNSCSNFNYESKFLIILRQTKLQ